VLALAVTAAAVLLPAHAAMAHGDEGALEVVEATPSDVGSTVTYRVSLTYANDGDPVDGATVTATAVLQGQPPEPPITMTGANGGIYEATVAFPSAGAWNVQFAADDPVATAQVSFTVEAPPTTTEAPAASTVPPTSAVAPDDATLADDEGDSDGPPLFLFVGLAVAAAMLLSAGVALFIRRRGGTPEDGA
jgi:hypothetical protein